MKVIDWLQFAFLGMMLVMLCLTQLLAGMFSKRTGYSLSALKVLTRYSQLTHNEKKIFKLFIASVLIEVTIFLSVLCLLLSE